MEKQKKAELAALVLKLKVKDFTDTHVRFEDPSYYFSIPWQSVDRLVDIARMALNVGPFICGHGGQQDDMGLYEKYFICPQYGLDGAAIYKKVTEYSGPGY